MRVIILTSTRKSTAAYFIPQLVGNPAFEIAALVYSEGITTDKKKHYKRILKKIFQIGIFGALNGIRMRKWYGEGVQNYLQIDDIEIVCARYGIPFLKTGNINSQETIKHFKNLHPDLALSLGNSYIGSKVFTIPKYGMINVHGEILPDYKNAQSVIWQIYNGSKYTGYTIHEINKGIDTGRILKQEKFPIIFREKLHETVSATCAEILKKASLGMIDVLNDFISCKEKAVEQVGGEKYTTPSIFQFFRILKNHRSMNRHIKDS